MAAPLAVWAVLGASAGAAAAHQTPPADGATRQAATARGHAREAQQRRSAGACSTTRARAGAKPRGSCRTTSRTASHAPRPPRRLAALRKPVRATTGAPTGHAGTIAKVLPTPCQNTQLIPETENLALVRAAVLCLINDVRAQNGLEPLRIDQGLERAAESHGQEMLALDYFDHVSPSGLTPVQRVRTTGYLPSSEVGYVVGENLAWGTLTLASPQSIVNAWVASPEHLANILEGKYRDTGIDVEPAVPEELAEGVGGALYTQEFGVIVQ